MIHSFARLDISISRQDHNAVPELGRRAIVGFRARQRNNALQVLESEVPLRIVDQQGKRAKAENHAKTNSYETMITKRGEHDTESKPKVTTRRGSSRTEEHDRLPDEVPNSPKKDKGLCIPKLEQLSLDTAESSTHPTAVELHWPIVAAALKDESTSHVDGETQIFRTLLEKMYAQGRLRVKAEGKTRGKRQRRTSNFDTDINDHMLQRLMEQFEEQCRFTKEEITRSADRGDIDEDDFYLQAICDDKDDLCESLQHMMAYLTVPLGVKKAKVSDVSK